MSVTCPLGYKFIWFRLTTLQALHVFHMIKVNMINAVFETISVQSAEILIEVLKRNQVTIVLWLRRVPPPSHSNLLSQPQVRSYSSIRYPGFCSFLVSQNWKVYYVLRDS